MDHNSSSVPSIIYKRQLENICQPLTAIKNIKYFVFYIIFNSNQRFILSTTPEDFLLFYWGEKFYQYDYSAEIISFKDKNYYLCDQNLGAELIFKETLESRFKMYRTFYIKRNCSEGRLIFGALHDKQIENPEYVYKASIDKFENFCTDFLNNVINLIKFYNPQYAHSIILNDKSYRNSIIKRNINITEYLSEREIECLLWAAYGKSSDETAEILKIKK